MEHRTIAKAALLMLMLVGLSVATYELYLRSRGIEATYDEGPALWADKRAAVYAPAEKQIVFIGSSRIKFDLDIPTWRKATGLDAVQLAIVGSSPRPMLEDLANDPNFRGRLIVDVTEPLFFSSLPPYVENPIKNIKYFHSRTLAQEASFELNQALESELVLLDKDKLSLNATLDELQLPNRPGVFTMPVFPMEFDRTDANRQTFMTDRFAKDPAQVNIVRNIWLQLFKAPQGPPMTDAQIMEVLLSVKSCTDKIRARGGEVIFLRTPSSGPFLQGESMLFPRTRFWDRLIAVTGCRGIHFGDYRETAHFQCPEFSHLSRPDARKFTAALVGILNRQNIWNIPSIHKI